MRKKIALGTVLALAVGGPAFAADGISYNNVEAGYVRSEVGSENGDGFLLAGSAAFGENLFGFARYTDADFDAGFNARQFSLGAGFNWALGPSMDLVSGFSFENARVGIPGVGSASESGFGLSAGVRGRIADQLELTGTVKYIDLGRGIDDFTISGGGRYYFTEAFAAGIDVSNNDDGTTWGIVVRYDFGRR